MYKKIFPTGVWVTVKTLAQIVSFDFCVKISETKDEVTTWLSNMQSA